MDRWMLFLFVFCLSGCGQPNNQTAPTHLLLDVAFHVKKKRMGKAKVRMHFNALPVVTSIWAQIGSVKPGQSVLLYSEISDPDYGPHTFQWKDSCGGSFLNSSSAYPQWTAPPKSPTGHRCTLSLTVTDNKGGVGRGFLKLQVGQPKEINLSPRVQNTLQSAEKVRPGETVLFRVTAMDPEGSKVYVRWFARKGKLLRSTESSPNSFQVKWQAPYHRSTYFIFAKVTDATGAWSLERFKVRVQ